MKPSAKKRPAKSKPRELPASGLRHMTDIEYESLWALVREYGAQRIIANVRDMERRLKENDE
jgi:hypothetical protein